MTSLKEFRAANVYAYVRGNPMSKVEPVGLFTEVVVSYESGFGVHAAVYTSRGSGGGPALYAPAGNFGDQHGGGDSGVVVDLTHLCSYTHRRVRSNMTSKL